MREIEKFSCLSKEVQESQQQDLMSEYQKVLKISQKIERIQDKRRKMQKESAASQEEMLKIREEIDRNEERFRQLSDKVDKYIMVDAAMAAELQGLKAGEERRGSNASQAVDCCMETMLEQFFAVGADQARSKFDATPSAQMPGKGGGRNSEDEQEQGKAGQQLALSVSGGCNEGTSASSLELDLPRVRGSMVNVEEDGNQAQIMSEKDPYPIPQGDLR